jgi:hypothetical protein
MYFPSNENQVLYYSTQISVAVTKETQIPGANSPGRIKFVTLAPNIRGSSVWEILDITNIAP